MKDITYEEALLLGTALQEPLKDAHKVFKEVALKIAKNPSGHSDEKYDQLLWQQMAEYCAERAGMLVLDSQDIMLRYKYEAD